jgi:transposase
MPAKYPQEVKDRTVRLVLDRRGDYPTEWAAITAIAAKSGITKETVRRWVRQAEIDAGVRAGVTSEEAAELKRLRSENRELKRANEILKAASAFFAAELDRPQR